MNKMFFVLFGTAVLAGCTDAGRKQITTMGSAAEISCYSGGQVIFQGRSTGKVLTEEHSDGWYFEDAASGKLIRVSGDCVIKN